MGLIDFVIAGLCLNATCDIENESRTRSSSFNGKFDALVEELSHETLRISTFQNADFSGFKEINGTIVGQGVAFDVINILQEKYKFNYTIVLPEENVFLNDSHKPGAKSLLETNKADLVAAFLPIVQSFRNEITYSRAFGTSEWLALMNRPKDSATGSGLLAPFTTPVWILIIFSVLVVGPIIHLLVFIQTRLCKNDQEKVYPLQACMWFVYGALLKQGSTLSPKADSSRMLFSTWWLFILILTAFYTANLTAFLTLSQFTLPISNVEDIGHKQYKWVTNRANGIRDIIYAESNEPISIQEKVLGKIGNKQNYVDMEDTMILENYVKEKGMIFIRERYLLTQVLYDDYKKKTRENVDEVKRCTFVLTHFPVINPECAFAYNKNFKYARLFDDTIQHLVESGIVQFKLTEFLPDTEICPLNLGNTERKLRNSDLLLTYIIVGAGLAIAATVFVIEIGWRIVNRKAMIRTNIQRNNFPKPIYEDNNNLKFNKKSNVHNISPPPDYQSLFKPPLYYGPRDGHKRTINGRDYWVLHQKNGFPGLIPLRTPSALLFQYSN